jgi:4-amino-4-deoxy-L-arabinose transferase-like glycosyltransferase
MEESNNSWYKASFSLFTMFFVLALFLPRIVKKGMFGDGLLYAAMSRNMSIGKGSMWQPYFSSSYWVPDLPATYFENPPLMLWVQSHFFTVFGDFWWVEKLFCACLLVINILLLRQLWQTIFSTDKKLASFSWLVVLLWYCIPIVIWGNVNNLMDNFLLSFCLLANICIFNSQNNNPLDNPSTKPLHRYFWLVCAGIFILLGVLAKGPVALYPLGLPFLYYLIIGGDSFGRMCINTLIILITVVFLFFVLINIDAEAMYFFTMYWEQRLKAVISGSRSDLKLVGFERLHIVRELAIEVSSLVGLSGIAWWFSRKYKSKIANMYTRLCFLFVLLGLGASLPILISSKQSGIYLIPGLPMFAVAAAIFIASLYKDIYPNGTIQKVKKYMSLVSVAGIVTVFIYSFFIFGDKRREADLIKDIESMLTVIPPDTKISICRNMSTDFVIYTYMQRMGRYELTDLGNSDYMVLSHADCNESEEELIVLGYHKIPHLAGHFMDVYTRIK